MCVCAGRTYCETDIDPAHRKLSQRQAVVQYLTGKEPDLKCKFFRVFLCKVMELEMYSPYLKTPWKPKNKNRVCFLSEYDSFHPAIFIFVSYSIVIC